MVEPAKKVDLEMDEISSALRSALVLSSLPPANDTKKQDPPKKKKGGDEEKAPKTKKKKDPKQQQHQQQSSVSTKSTLPPYDRWTLRDPSSVEYGLAAKSSSSSSGSSDSHSGNKYYLTTAINYTNGPAHMGHAYEAVTADCLARFARVRGDATRFVTGSDEHGQKIAATAESESQEPIDLCDKYVRGFQCLNQRVLVSNDDYVRTTSERHARTAQALWNKCAQNVAAAAEGGESDIYLSKYAGWYNVREETFVTDSDAQLSDYKDPVSGVPLKEVEEESYFFRMSRYHDRLLSYIEDNADFIRPANHRNAILSRLRADRLRDLSVSRTTFSWGIPVPEGFADNHIMYVWFDALSNYLTGVDALGVNAEGNDDDGATLASFWPADCHIIGKDILWFHTVIWPCILFSAGLELPKTVFAHGFVNDKDGKKMSKSLNNVVNPHDMLDQYGLVETFRWYLLKEAPYGGELSFNPTSLVDMHNADLADTLGNLVHRATNLCAKYCQGVVPSVSVTADTRATDWSTHVKTYFAHLTNYELEGGAHVAMTAFREVNGYLTERAPWHVKGEGEEAVTHRQTTVRAVLEALYALAHLLLPYLPLGGKRILLDKLHTQPKLSLHDLDPLMNLTAGTEITVGEILYSKILTDAEKEEATSKHHKAEAYAEAQKRKKEKKQKEIAASKKGQQGSAGDPNQPDFTKMEIRVGLIQKVWYHQNADKLFCEDIDVGEKDGPRQIASGLRGHYTLEQMDGRKVLVVCNLKKAKIVGFESSGMVLAAKSPDGAKVELVNPPTDAEVGERVYIEGLSGDPFSSAQVKKKKIWEQVAKNLVTAERGVATWDNRPIRTTKGVCSVETLVGAAIS